MARFLTVTAVTAACVLPLCAQVPGPAVAAPGGPVTMAPVPSLRLLVDHVHASSSVQGDHREWVFYGGLRLRLPDRGIEIRAQRALALSDLDGERTLLAQVDGTDGGALRRGLPLPEARRRLTPQVLQDRLASLLRAAGAMPAPVGDDQALALELPRYLYFEGGVIVLRDGVEVIRAERAWISPADDRMVVEQAELRYVTAGRDGERVLTVRGPKLVKEGSRWSGRDLTFTSCTAGEPHVAVVSGEVEVIERGDQFEVRGRDNWLQISGSRVIPLPDAHFFSDDQSEFPIRRASAGYSEKEGARLKVDLGLTWNGTGGGLHELLTGRPAHEFRGDWGLGVGWIEKRGFPLDGELSYRAKGLYEGRSDVFWMDDDGPNIREVVDRIDGDRVTDRNRYQLRTQNRVHLGSHTHLDLEAFQAGDEAVYSEFFRGDYHDREAPETSVYLHHADDNRLLTINGRWNLDSFSYRDDRGLAPAFVEELPVATFHWLAETVATTPWATPIVFDASTELGQRRSDFDDRFGSRVADRTFRADQVFELSAPMPLGPVSLRPYANTRLTWFDHAADGRAEDRLAFEVGVRAGTRLSRTWSLFAEDGSQIGYRHVLSPIVTFADRFHVEGEPGDYRQFDPIDALTERQLVRLEVRNLLQEMEPIRGGRARTRDFIFLDLAQDFWPDAARDNGGEQVGLFSYDLLIRPRTRWIPLPGFAFGFEGEHDWERGMRTRNTEVRVGPLAGVNWTFDYRTDRAVDGAVGVGASTSLLSRWNVFTGSQYDLDRDDWLTWSFGLQRIDHDWTIQIGVGYDPFTDETSFRLEFQPTLGGLTRAREADWFGNSRYHGPGSAAEF
ncbi:MAG: hypothetical protein IPK26_18560 [Planctomycetes bacterium]|nr:hypothetical protein [Planctomycetota bacterium]